MAQDPNQQQNFNPDPFAQQFPTPDQNFNPNVNNTFDPNNFNTPVQDPFAQTYPGTVAQTPAQNFYTPNNDYPQGDYGNVGYPTPSVDPSVGQNLASDYPVYQTPTAYPAAYPVDGDPNLQTPMQDTSNYGANLGPDMAATPVPNSFTEKKSGNKTVLFILGIIVAGLLIATGVLVFLNYNRSNNAATNTSSSSSSSSSSTSSSSSSSVSSSSSSSSSNVLSTTGGANTPASLARKSSLTQLSSDWVLKQFTKPDRDDDGKCVNLSICSETADPDNDGLANIEELNFASDPLKSDTDGDGISDGDEVSIYYTDPLKSDSDGDTFPDGSELSNCFDPAFVQTVKMSTTRLNQIAVSAGFKPISSTTTATLRRVGASSTDITRGYVEATCTVVSSSSSSSSTATVSSSSSSVANSL